MNLDESQKQRVAAWVAEGLKLADVQKRMETELGIRMTYMELRLLIDDLKVMPKDPDPAETGKNALGKGQNQDQVQAADDSRDLVGEDSAEASAWPPDRGVSVTIDAVTRPGALVSGGVQFSDGQRASWYLDQTGRLGLNPQQQGYRPSPADLQAFQIELQSELQKMGF